MTIERYLDLKREVIARGHAEEVDWAEGMKPVTDPLKFWQEFAWVVLNSGMKNQIARQIWNRVRPVVEAGGSAGTVFGHKGKAAAIDMCWKNRILWLESFRQCRLFEDKLRYLEGLPWIGGITKWHLAKNLGVDCAKPDRHLVRIAGEEGTHALCKRLHEATGDRIATVDVVIWRAANLGLV